MKQTPLTHWHEEHGGKLVEFGGYSMPIDYGSIMEEHEAVRSTVGIFDVSHMGEFDVTGSQAVEFLDHLVTNHVSTMAIHQALYTPMCNEDGGTVDDLLIYRIDDQHFMLVVNAANIEKDWNWITSEAQAWPNVSLVNESDQIALLAIQGPKSEELLQELTSFDLGSLSYYHFAPRVTIAGVTGLLSRTGYTGEDGFEFYVAASDALRVWDSWASHGARPVGLGARDTLRLEARLPLYGHELSSTISPLAAGLAPFVRLKDKTDFVGREALARQKSEGLSSKVVGIRLSGGIARAGYEVVGPDGATVGIITSGSYAPTLKMPIALALVPLELGKIGTQLGVNIRGRQVAAEVIKTPFYKRS